MDLQLFQPTAGAGTTFRIDRPEVLRHRTYLLGLATSFAGGLLERTSDGSTQEVAPWRFQNELLFAIGLFEWIQLGVALPVTWESVARDPLATTIETHRVFGFSDPRLTVKVPIVRGDFSLAGEMLVTLPASTGKDFRGSDYWQMIPSVIAAYRTGDVVVTGQVGYALRKRAALGNLEWDDELQLTAGVSWAFSDWASLIGEGQYRVGLGGRSIAPNQNPMELDAGLRFAPHRRVTVDVGGGTGLLAGYGAPLYRAFAILRYTNEDEPCAEGPEDFDGFEDGDFCLDPDNDADRVPDAQDLCPNDPETVDEFADDDGCPDLDDDADGLLDAQDRCPRESEDRDDFEDDDGCPEPDNDEDGVLDGVDSCPMEPEDRDNFQDEDGCPEPGPRQAVITVTDTRILISERIYFDFGTDVIRSVSFPLLDQVAEVVMDLPPRRMIRVEGYSDSVGVDAYNLDLSYRRARAVVEYLVAKGVPEARLSYVGNGEANPIAPNDSPEGRAMNRRVEFTILNPDAATPTPTAPPNAPRGRNRRGGR